MFAIEFTFGEVYMFQNTQYHPNLFIYLFICDYTYQKICGQYNSKIIAWSFIQHRRLIRQ
jgi:hypothetical protein